MKLFFERNANQEESHWISLSDLMAGLMMVFLLISIAFMTDMKKQRDILADLARAYQNTQTALYDELKREFKDSLTEWDAEIVQETLEFKFNSPDVLFDTGEILLKPRFKEIIDDFFPRYLSVIKRFKDDIVEIRIEGHTSSIWNDDTSVDQAYFNNMRLSQGRTRAVLLHVYKLPEIQKDKEWVKSKFAAVGYSSAHPIPDLKGNEDMNRSKRVSFKILTNADRQIKKILDAYQKQSGLLQGEQPQK